MNDTERIAEIRGRLEAGQDAMDGERNDKIFLAHAYGDTIFLLATIQRLEDEVRRCSAASRGGLNLPSNQEELAMLIHGGYAHSCEESDACRLIARHLNGCPCGFYTVGDDHLGDPCHFELERRRLEAQRCP